MDVQILSPIKAQPFLSTLVVTILVIQTVFSYINQVLLNTRDLPSLQMHPWNVSLGLCDLYRILQFQGHFGKVTYVLYCLAAQMQKGSEYTVISKEILISDTAKRPCLLQKKEASTGWGRCAFQPFALVNLGNPYPDTNSHQLDSTARVCTPATHWHKAQIPLSTTSLRETESHKIMFDPPPTPLLIMDYFGLLYICNQMLLLFTHSSLCLNWEGSCLNIYLNNNIPWVLCKWLYKINPKHPFKKLIKLVFCLSTVL